MTDTVEPLQRTWLTIPDAAELLSLSPGRVRKLLEDHHLVASRRDGVLMVPEDFIVNGAPLGELRGTIIVLRDCGFTDDEVMEWLLSTERSLAAAPIDALRDGRKAEVRRVAQALA